eukprot:241435_1
MYPLVDFCNNADLDLAMNARIWKWESFKGIRAMRDISVGEEILISYGHRANDVLFNSFGFIIPGNANASTPTIYVDSKSLPADLVSLFTSSSPLNPNICRNSFQDSKTIQKHWKSHSTHAWWASHCDYDAQDMLGSAVTVPLSTAYPCTSLMLTATCMNPDRADHVVEEVMSRMGDDEQTDAFVYNFDVDFDICESLLVNKLDMYPSTHSRDLQALENCKDQTLRDIIFMRCNERIICQLHLDRIRARKLEIGKTQDLWTSLLDRNPFISRWIHERMMRLLELSQKFGHSTCLDDRDLQQ